MKKIEGKATLYKNKYEPIADISDYILNEVKKYDECNEISFKISKVLSNNRVNPYYDDIKGKRQLITDRDRYIIEDIEEVKEANKKNDYKTFTAYSFEKTLEKRNISLEGSTYILFPNDTHQSKSIMDYIKEITGWSYKIDKSIIDNVEYKYIEADNNKVLTFLREVLEPIFNVYFDFDTINKIIYVYSRDSFGKEAPMYLDYENLIKTVNIKEDVENIVTRLNVTGLDDLSIKEQHIFNTNYIEDFTYLIDSDSISKSLKGKIEEYSSYIKGLNGKYNALKDQKDELESSKLQLNTNLEIKQEEIQKKRDLLSGNIKDEDKEKTEIIAKEITALENDIEDIVSSIGTTNTKILEIEEKLKELGESVRKENSNIFTPDELDELNEYIIEEEYNDDSAVTSLSLYNNAKEVLKDKNIPLINFTLDIKSFRELLQKNRKYNVDSLKEGDIFILLKE